MAKIKKFKVLEVDQYTATKEEFTKLTLDDFIPPSRIAETLEKIFGSNACKLRAIGLIRVNVLEVSTLNLPPTGYSWFKPRRNGKLARWRTTPGHNG